MSAAPTVPPIQSVLLATAAAWGPPALALCRGHGLRAQLLAEAMSAVLALAGQRPALAVLDFALPGVDWPGLCRSLPAQPGLAQLAILPVVDGGDRASLAACAALGLAALRAEDDPAAALGRWLAARAGAADPAAPAPSATDAEAARPRVLLVDDDRDLLRAMQLRLQPYDLEVHITTSGREALWTAAELKPDLVITDYSMPEGNGEYVLARLRQDPALQAIPVIVMTGWTIDGGLDASHQRDMLGPYRAAAYLRKPVEAAALLAEVGRHVRLTPRAA